MYLLKPKVTSLIAFTIVIYIPLWLVLIEADAVVGTVRRVGAVAVGVGVAQTKDMFFHRLFPFQISPRDWRK